MGPSELLQLAGSVGGLMALALVLAYVVAPKAIDAWKSRHHEKVELAVVTEREATSRHRLAVKDTGLAADMVRERAAALDAREAEHAAERQGHVECLQKLGTLEGRVVAAETAQTALERVVLWLLDRVGLTDDTPPDEVAKTLARIRPTAPPMEPAE